MNPAICDTPNQTHFVQNSIFLHFVMVMTVLWAELWSVVARCNLAGNVGNLQQHYFDKLDTWISRGGTFCLLILRVLLGLVLKGFLLIMKITWAGS